MQGNEEKRLGLAFFRFVRVIGGKFVERGVEQGFRDRGIDTYAAGCCVSGRRDMKQIETVRYTYSVADEEPQEAAIDTKALRRDLLTAIVKAIGENPGLAEDLAGLIR